MLVNQRGCIVESLRQLAQSNSEPSHDSDRNCQNCSRQKSAPVNHQQQQNSFEQVPILRILNFGRNVLGQIFGIG
jgi:hypothetical protein